MTQPNVTVQCPNCFFKIDASGYEDPSVGIYFDYDELDTSECQCDPDDDKLGEAKFEAVRNKYYRDPEDSGAITW